MRTRTATTTIAVLVALVALLWAARMRIVNSFASWAAGVDVEIETLSLLANDTHSATLLLEDIRVLMPQSSDVFASVQSARVELHRESNFVILGDCAISGVAFHFVAFDALLSDTNVRRLLLAMYPNEEAATESSYVTYQRVALSDVTINPELRSDGYSVSLPAITLLGETLEGEVLHGAGVSVSLLNWLAGVVIHALASTTLDGVGGALDGGVALLASTIEVALDVVSVLSTNKIAKHVPGQPLLAGATEAARRVVGGLARASGALVRGAVGGAKEVAGARLTPVDLLEGVERAGHAFAGGLSDGAAAVADGAASGAARLIEGVEESVPLHEARSPGLLGDLAAGTAAALGLAAGGASSVVGGVARGAAAGLGGVSGGSARVLGGVGDGAHAALGGLADGGVAAVNGLARGLGAAAGSAARGDLAGVVEGGGAAGVGVVDGVGAAAQGLGRGAAAFLGGALSGARYLGAGLAEGVGAVARGVLEPVDDVASAAAALVTGGGGVDRCTTHAVRQGRRRGGAAHVRICAAG